MTKPGAEPVTTPADKAHRHIDLGALMDGSERGPKDDEGLDAQPNSYGEASEISGETSAGYVSGQDEGSID